MSADRPVPGSAPREQYELAELVRGALNDAGYARASDITNREALNVYRVVAGAVSSGAAPTGPPGDEALREAVRQMIGACRGTVVVPASDVEHYLPIMAPIFAWYAAHTHGGAHVG